MKSLSSRLNCRVSVYTSVEKASAWDTAQHEKQFVKKVWAEIVPLGGRLEPIAENVRVAELSHRITIRKGALEALSNEMEFEYEGQRYEVKYFQPHFKVKDSIEVFTRLVVE